MLSIQPSVEQSPRARLESGHLECNADVGVVVVLIQRPVPCGRPDLKSVSQMPS